ncbi:MAG: succinate dehydrogenase assembly factor 2 [Beijerinckiaceae bacterium]|jgi:antitoxin CptB
MSVPLGRESIPRGSEGLDVRRRRILFRSRHRGMREMDLIMGGFADSQLGDLPEEDIDALEILLDLPDHDVFSWLTGDVALPAAHDTPVFRKLKSFSYA